MKQVLGASLTLLAFLLLTTFEAHAACNRQYGMARFPALVPSLGKYACPVTENAPSGKIIISQEYEFSGVTLKSFFKNYRRQLERKGWQIAGIRTVPLLHAMVATHNKEGLTIEFSASEKKHGEEMIDVKRIDPKTFDPDKFDGFNYDRNAREFSGKVVLKRR